MTTTTKTADYMGRALTTPDTDARDYINLPTIAGDRDYMGRALTGGGGGPDAAALLAEAAVRFDFSQYTDVDDMVDVNGGWGPLDVSQLFGTPSFTADGLRLLGDGSGGIDINSGRLKLESVSGPLVLGADGMTFVSVVSIAAALNMEGLIGNLRRGQITFSDLGGDSDNSYSPELTGDWRGHPTVTDTYALDLYDLAPGYQVLVGQTESGVPSTLTSRDVDAGVFVLVVAVDVDGDEVRFSHVSPLGRFDDTVAFAMVAEFPAVETVLDSLYCYTPRCTDSTLIEWDGWNRALTPAEVDALVAHFTP